MVTGSCGTKVIKLVRCLNCWKINDASFTKCSGCNFLFTGEATEQERIKANNKLANMRKKSLREDVDDDIEIDDDDVTEDDTATEEEAEDEEW